MIARRAFLYSLKAFLCVGSMALIGTCVWLLISGSVVGLNVVVAVAPAAMIGAWAFFGKQWSRVALAAMPSAVMWVLGMVLFGISASAGVDVPGGSGNFSCSSESLAQALIDPSAMAPPEAKEVSFLSSCGAGWSEVLNYRGLRVARKCCVRVDVRRFDCAGSGLRLVPDASENPQVITDTATRVATAVCCPSLTQDTAPTGFAPMVVTALSATIFSILTNLLKRSHTWKTAVTTPAQRALAFVSEAVGRCVSRVVCVLACCLDEEQLDEIARPPRKVQRRRRKADATQVKTLTEDDPVVQATFTDTPTTQEQQQVDGAAGRSVPEGCSIESQTVEFSLHGQLNIVLNGCTAMTPCGRYTLVCGGDARGVQHEVLYDSHHLPYPVPFTDMAEIGLDPQHASTAGRPVRPQRRFGSQLDTPSGLHFFSICSRYVGYFAAGGALWVRCNETCRERRVESWKYGSFARTVSFLREDLVLYDFVTGASCGEEGAEGASGGKGPCLVAVSRSQVAVVPMDALFSSDEEMPSLSESLQTFPLDPELARHLMTAPRSNAGVKDVRMTKNGLIVSLCKADDSVSVWDALGQGARETAARRCSATLPGPFHSIIAAGKWIRPGCTNESLQLLLGWNGDKHVCVAIDPISAADVSPAAGDGAAASDRRLPSISVTPMPLAQVITKHHQAQLQLPTPDGHPNPSEGNTTAVAVQSGRSRVYFRFVANGNCLCMWTGHYAFLMVGATVHGVARFPRPIDSLEACRTEGGQTLLFASLQSSKQLHVRVLDPLSEGETSPQCCDVNAIHPLFMTSDFRIAMSPNGAYVVTRSTECAQVFGTSLDEGRLPLLAKISGDFLKASFSPDSMLVGFERQTDVLMCPTVNGSVCALALVTAPCNDVDSSSAYLARLTMASGTSILRSTVRLADDTGSCPPKRMAEVMSSQEIVLPGTPKYLQLVDGGQTVVAHLHDGSLHLFGCLGNDVAERIPLPPQVADNNFWLVRLTALQNGSTLIGCVEHQGKLLREPSGCDLANTSSSDAMLTLLELRGKTCTYRGTVRLMLQALAPSLVLGVGATTPDNNTSSEGDDDERREDRITVQDLALSKDGSVVAGWMSNHDGVHIWPLRDCIAPWGSGTKDDVASLKQVDDNGSRPFKSESAEFPLPRRGSQAMAHLVPICLAPSPLLADQYGSSWGATSLGELRFHSEQPHTLLRMLRPSGHWTFHVEEWHLGATAALPEDSDGDANVIDAGAGRVIRIAPVRTDRVGYMTGDPSVVRLNMSANCGAMVLLSSHGVSLYRRPPTGDDNDRDANAFFWWSGFVAALYAPSEYLAVPLGCFVYGYVSSAVAAASGREGIAGFASRVCNGSTLQNWVDIVTVFACRALIVRSGFLPVCGNAELTTVNGNDPETRSSYTTGIVKALAFVQVLLCVMYPLFLIYTLPGFGVFVVPLSVLIVLFGALTAVALVGILVRRSYQRKRWIGPPPPSVERWARIASWCRFYAKAMRLFVYCFVFVVGTNFTLQVALRMATNFELMDRGTGDYKRFYDACLQYTGDCTACAANGCHFCPSSTGTCVSPGRTGGCRSALQTTCSHTNATAGCAAYDGNCAMCSSFADCAYCQSSGACYASDASGMSSCGAVTDVLVLQNSTCRADRSVVWWQHLPYLSPATANKAQMLFYTLQISSGTCSAARIAQSTWATANYFTSIP